MKSPPAGIKSIFVAVLVLTFLIPINVFAQTPFYLAFKAGIYSPQSSDLEGSDNGFSGEFMFGYRFHPNIAGEVGIGYFNTDVKETVGRTPYVGRDVDIYVCPITLTLRAILPYKKWDFFGFGGAGIYIVSREYDDYYDEDHHHHHHDDDYDYDSKFGVYLGAGVHYNITPKIFVGVEGRYLWTDKVDLEYQEFRMDGIIAHAVFGFRF